MKRHERKRWKKIMLKNEFFNYFIFCKLYIIDSFGIIKSNFTKYPELFFNIFLRGYKSNLAEKLIISLFFIFYVFG